MRTQAKAKQQRACPSPAPVSHTVEASRAEAVLAFDPAEHPLAELIAAVLE